MTGHTGPPPIPVDVAVIGAGPVGLYLATHLAQAGVRVAVLESRRAPALHSRAIGLHPPGLAALAEVGAAEPLVARGVAIVRGRAYGGLGRAGPRPLGVLSLDAALPGPFPYVLSVPQRVTEEVLTARLCAAAPSALRRGVRVTGVRRDASGVTLSTEAAGGVAPPGLVHARVAVACDGGRGRSAAWLGVPVRGGPYRDHYLMADLPDDGGLGDDAAIFLARGGVVESFPLPAGRRRWVARTDRPTAEADPHRLARTVAERTGVHLAVRGAVHTSAFGTERRLAARLAEGRLWLCGDAAHVVSPIGGQGMNLGLVGAARAARGVRAALRGELGWTEAERAYDHRQRAAARRAARRAAWNMRLGRPTPVPWAREAAVRGLLRPPAARWAARLFTMQA